MLVEFTVKNYRSIKEEQVFSMVKATGGELESTNSFQPSAPASVALLRSAAVYGANAAGKSNIIRAMMEMESIVRTSASSSQEGDEISVTPFLFDESSCSEPTEFEMVFISEGVRFQFGFCATKTHIVEEWLIAYPKGRAQRWYSRCYNKKKDTSEYKFSDFLLGQKSVWQNATRSNALFLSTAVQLNSDQLKPVFNWFKETLRPAKIGGWGPGFTASLCDKEISKARVLEFLKAADFDIHDIKIDKEKFDAESLPEDIPDSVKEKIVKEMKDKEIIDIKTIHKSKSGNLVPLDFDEESDGTQKFFSFAGPWIDTLNKGYVLVIDELHDNLHPKMVKYLVNLFHSNKTNPNNAQLIFTTHETSILTQNDFRRDQIWFCEKDVSQASSLYPLTDFSPRKDRENIGLGYLSGRYGALPFIRPFDPEAM
ncbi:ATP/GTP-binding protein [Reinekea marina]|uniref:ATP/GTP-binding protein n=1 Tax=Reinekea marina TaxID=1310421 RepID=A0ABV7WPF6_9GAMM